MNVQLVKLWENKRKEISLEALAINPPRIDFIYLSTEGRIEAEVLMPEKKGIGDTFNVDPLEWVTDKGREAGFITR